VKAIEERNDFDEEKAIEERNDFDKEQAIAVKNDFDKEQAITSIRKTEVYGNKGRQINCWPSVDELKAKSDETLKQLRITKIEWYRY